MPASVVVTDGIIAKVEPACSTGKSNEAGSASRPNCLDVGDLVIMPGVVDTHVHVNEPGRTEWEGFNTAGRAAAAGGVTTIVDMPLNCSPVTTGVAALNEKARRAAAKSRVSYGFWGGLVPGNADDLGPLLDAGVLGFKCFLVPSGIDEFPAVGETELLTGMRALAGQGAVLLVHAELPGPIELARRKTGGSSQLSDRRRYGAYLATRPPEAELEAIELIVRLSGETGCSTHIVHLSAAEALEPLARAREDGVPVTVETAPHYLAFSAEEVLDGATSFKCAPPIRDSANRERLWDGLRAGVIDLIATDHSPCPPDLKSLETGDFMTAWGGISSLGLALPAVWTEASRRGFDLSQLATWLCEEPARLAGLGDRKGRIAPGYDADLVVWDPEATFRVHPDRLLCRHKLTPYEGRELMGVVEQTWLAGVRVYGDGVVTEDCRGRWERRGSGRAAA